MGIGFDTGNACFFFSVEVGGGKLVCSFFLGMGTELDGGSTTGNAVSFVFSGVGSEGVL